MLLPPYSIQSFIFKRVNSQVTLTSGFDSYNKLIYELTRQKLTRYYCLLDFKL